MDPGEPMNEPLRVFIGYDPRQPVAYHVLAHSVWHHASRPVSITPLQLKGLPMKRRGLTEFTYSRFLVPWLSQYRDFSLFLDSDILCRADVFELLLNVTVNPNAAVHVVKHKELRFEWPSVMLFNNDKCRTLTPAYVDDEKHGLFDFIWASEVAGLEKDWNHLIGYDPANPDAKLIHYTQGIPCWPETKDTEWAKEWEEAGKSMVSTVSFNELMGRSVHAKHVLARLKANGG